MEHTYYRDNLADILEFTGGKHLLTVADVSRFTGIKNNQTLHKRFSFINATISAASLARQLCEGPNA